MGTLLELRNLKGWYTPETEVLKGLDLSLPQNSVIGLLTLTEFFKLVMLTLNSGEQFLATQLVLVGQEHDLPSSIYSHNSSRFFSISLQNQFRADKW